MRSDKLLRFQVIKQKDRKLFNAFHVAVIGEHGIAMGSDCSGDMK